MAYSQAFRNSVDLVLRVHQLMSADRGESPEANRLRAQSEKPWYEMTEDEQELAGGLSEDLYSIGQSWETAEDSGDDFTALFKEAQESDRWLPFLSRLRRRQREFPSHQLAFIRGLAWLNLKEPLVALEFFSEAIRLRPKDTQYLRCFLCTLNYEGLSSGPIVERVIRESDDALSLLHAAGILFNESQNAHPSDAKRLFESAFQASERAFQLAKKSQPDDLLIRELARTHLWLAIYYEGLGDTSKADAELLEAKNLGFDRDEVIYVETLFQKNRRAGSWGLLAQSYSAHQHNRAIPMTDMVWN